MSGLVPTKSERFHIARCLTMYGVLIGSEREIWTHPSATRALVTWRLCLEAITELIGGRHGIEASFIQACVMQLEDVVEVPFALSEVAEYLATDSTARLYWRLMCLDRENFPHRCPHCGAAAFVGFNLVDCKARCPASVPR